MSRLRRHRWERRTQGLAMTPGTNGSVGFRVLPRGLQGQSGVKGGAYLRYFGGPNNGLRVPLSP